MTTIKSAAVSAASKANAATRTRSARGRFEPVEPHPDTPSIEDTMSDEALALMREVEAPADRPKGRVWGRMRRDR